MEHREMRNAKIVCTLGPASDDRETIRALAEAGMAVARLNASHGTREDRADIVDRVRAVADETDQQAAVMLDLQGPEIRTAPLEGTVTLATGSRVRLHEGDDATNEAVGLSTALAGVAEGDRVLLNDGRIEMTVEAVEGDEVVCHVDAGGELGGRKGVNVPGVNLDLDVVTEKDRRDLELAAEKTVDFVAVSFVRDASDLVAVNEVLEAHGADVPLIAKIERVEAVENLAGIVDEAYGVMVARGDLGVECPLEEVPLIQKRIINRCQQAGVPVITATEMLDSMVRAPRPTRAEASDVANAVFDGTDAVMLSGETAVGDDPVRVVRTMDRIVREVEASDEYADTVEQRVPTAEESSTEALARSARYLARDVGATAVVVASESGYTALRTAKFRPGVPVVAATPHDRVRRQLLLSWGVNVQNADLDLEGPSSVIESAVDAALGTGAVESGDTVVVVSGMISELEDANTTNMLKVHVAAETVGVGRKVVGGRVAGPVFRSAAGDLTDAPEGAILVLPAEFDGEFTGDVHRIAGIVDARPGMTGYPALVARELDIPMVSGAPLPADVTDGTVVTLHAGRGVVYEGDVLRDVRRGDDRRVPGKSAGVQ